MEQLTIRDGEVGLLTHEVAHSLGVEGWASLIRDGGVGQLTIRDGRVEQLTIRDGEVGLLTHNLLFFPCSGECSPVERKSPTREEQKKDAEGGTVETKQNGEWVDG